MRGEYIFDEIPRGFGEELPPRARRILDSTAIFDGGSGTTSACAENTFGSVGNVISHGNYLRVRGEYKNPSPQVLAA